MIMLKRYKINKAMNFSIFRYQSKGPIQVFNYIWVRRIHAEKRKTKKGKNKIRNELSRVKAQAKETIKIKF